MPEEEDGTTRRHDRMDRIYRVWNTARTRQATSPPFELEQMAFLVSLVSLLPLIVLDSALLGYAPDDGLNRLFRVVDVRMALSLLAASFALQGWSIDRGLWALTPEPWSIRRWVRWLRPLLASVPIAGLLMVPAWAALLRRRPDWAFNEEAVPPGWSTTSCGLDRFGTTLGVVRPSWFFSQWSQLGLMCLGFLAVFVWAEWLWHSTAPSRHLLLVLGSIACHGLGFASIAYFLWYETRQSSSGRGRALPLLAVFWLVPLPLFGFLGILTLVFVGELSRRNALARQVFSERRRTPSWKTLKEKLRRSWQDQPWWRRLRRPTLEASAETTQTADMILLLARLKCLLLLPEGATLTQTVLWIGADRPWLEQILGFALLTGVGVAFILGCIASIVAGLRVLQGLFRVRDDSLPYAQYLAAGHLSFVVGFLWQGFLHTGQWGPAGGILLLYGGVGSLHFGLWPMFRDWLPITKKHRVRSRESLLWLLGFLFIAVSGLNLSTIEREAGLLELHRNLVLLLVLPGPIVSLLLFGWLLRPRNIQNIFDRNLSLHIRAETAFLAATVLLPLGGLVVPTWFHLRRKALEQ